jgi:hypothetical protein
MVSDTGDDQLTFSTNTVEIRAWADSPRLLIATSPGFTLSAFERDRLSRELTRTSSPRILFLPEGCRVWQLVAGRWEPLVEGEAEALDFPLVPPEAIVDVERAAGERAGADADWWPN